MGREQGRESSRKQAVGLLIYGGQVKTLLKLGDIYLESSFQIFRKSNFILKNDVSFKVQSCTT